MTKTNTRGRRAKRAGPTVKRTPTPPVPDGASAIEIDANDPETLYAGVLEGTEAVVWISRDGGSTWTTP